MANHFDDLIRMWHNTTDDHVDWQKKAKTMSIGDLFSYVQRLVKEEDEFDVKTGKQRRDDQQNNCLRRGDPLVERAEANALDKHADQFGR